MFKSVWLAIVLFIAFTACAGCASSPKMVPVAPPIATKPVATGPVTENAQRESYLFHFEKAFKSSDTGVTAKFLVVAAKGVTLIPTGTKEHGSVYMPTFFRMEVKGMSFSASASVIDQPVPYLLFMMQDPEYAALSGKTLPATFWVYGKQIKTQIKFLPLQ